MATPVVLKDNDSGITAKVTRFGQLVVAPLQYSTPVADEVDVANTAFNFIGPEQDQSIVITDIVLSADRLVGVNGADIVVYEADSPTTLTEDQIVLDVDMIKQTTLTLNGLNLIVPEGKFVNAKSDDTNIKITIMFYRVPAENV